MNAAVENYQRAREAQIHAMNLDDLEARGPATRACKPALEDAFRRLVEADQTDAEVLFWIGCAFHTGWGTGRDRDTARGYFQRAADAGHVRAMTKLGMVLRHPDAPDLVSAFKWTLKAAAGGEPSAMLFAGFALQAGEGVEANPSEAERWFLHALQHGEIRALVYLGRVRHRYLRDPIAAKDWFQKAVDAGYEECMVDLAMLHGERSSPAYDSAESVRWYRAVANKPGASAYRALIALARAARDGQGMTQDFSLAKSFLEVALATIPVESSFRKEAAKLHSDMEDSLL